MNLSAGNVPAPKIQSPFGNVDLTAGGKSAPQNQSPFARATPAPPSTSPFANVSLTTKAEAPAKDTSSAHQTRSPAQSADQQDKPLPEEFYTDIRGLNWSLAQSIVRAFNESDGYADMHSLLGKLAGKYVQHRDSILERRVGKAQTQNPTASSHEVPLQKQVPSSAKQGDQLPVPPTAPAEHTSDSNNKKNAEATKEQDTGPVKEHDTEPVKGKDRDSAEEQNGGTQAEPQAATPQPPRFGNLSFSFAGQSADKIMSKSKPSDESSKAPTFDIPAGGFSFAGSSFSAPSSAAPESKQDEPQGSKTSDNKPEPVGTPPRNVGSGAHIKFGSAPGKSPVTSVPSDTSPHRFTFGTSQSPVGNSFANTAGAPSGAFHFGAPINFDSPPPPKRDKDESK